MTEHLIRVASIRANVCQDMLNARLSWIESRWGSEFAAHVAWHYAEGMPLDHAEFWSGMQFGIIDDDTVQTLSEAAELEDIREERIEHLAQMALAHGF